MSVAVQCTAALCHVAILGKLETHEQRAELQAVLEDPTMGGDGKSPPLELNFYDADSLHADIIEALSARVERADGFKIIAYHASLAHSLMRLGLPVRQVFNQVARKFSGPCKALALAGSAKSLDKILHIVARLPVSDVAVFVAQHVQENQPQLLDQLLKTRTDFTVLMPQNLMPVRPGTIYVAPPGHHMRVAHGLVYLTCDRKIQFARPSIDALFESMASEYGPSAMAVLLCGFGQDGVVGCTALRAAGALVVVEDGGDCALARAMPDAARDAGCCDYVLKLASIASISAASLAGDQIQPNGQFLEYFLDALLSQYGYDFRGYNRDSLQRRIKTLTLNFGHESFYTFQCGVLSDAALFERFCAELSVGVTGFFRHPEQFRLLREDILPYLASFPVIKLWSAGCSTGEEAYSLAILLDELGLLERSHLFATDVNHYLLELAASGLFPSGPLASNREDYLASGGPRLFDAYVSPGGHFLKADERLRKHILFNQHSLADEGIFNEFQLIVCRNVMIYFNAELLRKVFQRFSQSLHPDGFLMLGPQDGLSQMAREQGFVPYLGCNSIFRRPRIQAHG